MWASATKSLWVIVCFGWRLHGPHFLCKTDCRAYEARPIIVCLPRVPSKRAEPLHFCKISFTLEGF